MKNSEQKTASKKIGSYIVIIWSQLMIISFKHFMFKNSLNVSI